MNTEIRLEDVYKLSGIPTHTFVKPVEYSKLLVSLRTPGRGLVVEGPSGIGKTTSIIKALDELNLADKTLKLTARKREDRELIAELPEMDNIGIVIVDVFHRLDDVIKQKLADYMKILADEEDETSKLIIIGINKAGDTLVKFASDLNNRIDTIKFEANPEERVMELIKKGEEALNINIGIKENIVKSAQGSFHITQLLCNWTCVLADITKRPDELHNISVSFELVQEKVIDELSRVFYDVARSFATGPRLRREGRAPYLHILHWLATSDEWTINLDYAIAQHPDQKGSVGQVVEKGYLANFIESNNKFSDIIHYDKSTHILNVEDPKFVYYIRNLLWSKFAHQIGYAEIGFKSKYDFALSFAGSNRDLAEALFNKLTEYEIAVFYDRNEQHRILASNVEEYLSPIYKSEATFIIVLLSKDYPKRIWAKFESEQFKSRFGEGAIIPIWYSDCPPGIFDESSRLGGYTYSEELDMNLQVNEISNLLKDKLMDFRLSKEDIA